ncbi:MAG: MFS transporter [Acidimicrobiia bacterium]|nr:MFS transporter [Acidimicrobiia bacterium]
MTAQPHPQAAVAWRGVVPAFAATAVGMLPGFLIAASAVQLRADIDFSLTGLGILIGVFFGVAAVVSPPMGRLSERVGWAAALRLAALLAALSLGGVGWLADSYLGLAAFLVIGGVASSLGQIASNLTVARCVHPARQGFVFGLRHASVPVAALLAGLAVPTITVSIGWEWGFRLGAALALVAAASIPRREARYVVNPAPLRPNGDRARPSTPLSLLLVLAVAVGLGTGGGDTLGSFIVSYSVDIGVAESTAGLLLALGSFVGLSARVLAGFFIDRSQKADLTAVAAMIATGAVGMVLLNLGGTAGLYGGSLLAFAAAWGWAGLFTFAVVRDNPNAPAAATGVTQLGKYVGAAAGPPVFGWIADTFSFTAAWWFSTTVLLVAATLILYVRNQRT